MSNKIKTLMFDLGGVIMTLSPEVAVRRFYDLGLKDASLQMNSYTQTGIFGEIEEGRISAETFRTRLSTMCGRELTWHECSHAWLGYVKEVPRRNLDALLRLKDEGYRVVLVSNTNPYMMEWVESTGFSGDGHALNHYLDKLYKSYELGVMKPDPLFFKKVIEAEHADTAEVIFLDDGPRNVEAARHMGIRSLLTVNGEDWRSMLWDELKKKNAK